MKYLLVMTRSNTRYSWPPNWPLATVQMARSLLRLGIWLAAVFALHMIAMMLFEGLTPFQSLWLTFTTILTVGYGDLSAASVPGRVSTMVLIYAGGIFVLAKGVGDYLDWRSLVAGQRARGSWRWRMKDHLLVIGHPTGQAGQYYARLVDQVRAHESWCDVPVQLLTTAFPDRPLPPALQDRHVVHWTGVAADPDDLAACCPGNARAVLVLANSQTDAADDARVYDTVDRVRAAGFTGPLVAECVDERNRTRLRRAGATATVRAMHGFPEMAARALVAPGAEALVETLFTAEGDECRRFELTRAWTGRWTDLTVLLVDAGIGIPIGYMDPGGAVHGNPVGRTVEAAALFVIVHDTRQSTAHQEIEAALFPAGRTRAA